MTQKKLPPLLTRTLRTASILCLTLVLLTGVAMAQSDGKGKGKDKDKDKNKHKHGVPELNLGSMAGGLTLLSGGLLILTDKFNRRKKTVRG